jgi:hypothetical protein
MKEVVREDFHGCFGIFTYLVGVHTGLPIAVAATAALLQLPYFAALSMPMACLAASLFGLGRLQVILGYRFCCPYCYWAHLEFLYHIDNSLVSMGQFICRQIWKLWPFFQLGFHFGGCLWALCVWVLLQFCWSLCAMSAWSHMEACSMRLITACSSCFCMSLCDFCTKAHQS